MNLKQINVDVVRTNVKDSDSRLSKLRELELKIDRFDVEKFENKLEDWENASDPSKMLASLLNNLQRTLQNCSDCKLCGNVKYAIDNASILSNEILTRKLYCLLKKHFNNYCELLYPDQVNSFENCFVVVYKGIIYCFNKVTGENKIIKPTVFCALHDSEPYVSKVIWIMKTFSIKAVSMFTKDLSKREAVVIHNFILEFLAT